jgi:exodeoxyribonuclease-3
MAKNLLTSDGGIISGGDYLRFISWNVNGLRACVNKGFLDFFREMDADFFCVQETKLQEGQIELDLPGYEQYWNSAEKKGYSGTAVFTKHAPLAVEKGLGIPEHDQEGRLITLEYDNFFLVTVYTPNSQRGLARLDYRIAWEDAFRSYISGLNKAKPVIICGDLNVAHQEIDIARPEANRKNAGFTDEEREKFSLLLEAGFIDTFRHFYPDKADVYTWWAYFAKSRERNIGWRIDFFLASNALRDRLIDAYIYDDIMGSDHCPVGLEIELP